MSGRKNKFCVYRHFDASGDLLYVGSTINPFKRLAGHQFSSFWSEQIVKISIEWHESKELMLEAELTAIREEKPKYNIAGADQYPKRTISRYVVSEGKPLTEKQGAVLQFIKDHTKEKGIPPSRADICRNFGWHSPNAAQQMLDALFKKGYLRRVNGIARGLIPTCPSEHLA